MTNTLELGYGMCASCEQITPPSQIVSLPVLPVSPSKNSLTYQAIEGNYISDELIDSCAELFSSNYGIWGVKAPTISQRTKAGLLSLH